MNQPFVFKCKQCGKTHTLSPEWFNTTESKKNHSCSCGKNITIDTAKVREKKGYNFKKKTDIVSVEEHKESTVASLQLRVQSEKGETDSFLITKETVQIGRAYPTSSKIERDQNKNVVQRINVADQYVSSLHCQLQITDTEGRKRIKLKDMGSTNKTFFRGKQINEGEEVYVSIGDEIEIGVSKITLL